MTQAADSVGVSNSVRCPVSGVPESQDAAGGQTLLFPEGSKAMSDSNGSTGWAPSSAEPLGPLRHGGRAQQSVC